MTNAAVKDRLLTLGVGGQLFGVPSMIVREVTRMPRLARVPHGPAALMGLANIRGSVVPVLSLATLVELPAGDARRVVIVDHGEIVGLAVEEVFQLSAADIEVRSLDIAALVAKIIPASSERRTRDAGLVEGHKEESRAEKTLPLVIFAVGKQEFAFPIELVEEVLRIPDDIACLPLADAAVVGSMAVRGALLPLLSLRVLLALRGSDETKARVLVVRIGDQRVGFVVEAMRSILRVSEDDVDPLPQVLARGGAEARIQAICRLEDGKRLVSVLAADQLLRDNITACRFHGSGEHIDMGETLAEQAFERFLLFTIGGEEFGLPLEAVAEVALLPEQLTRLPKAPAFIKGVMNLRGQVIPVVDQAERFGADARAQRTRRVIVVRIGDLSAGFVVDAVSDLLRVEASALRPAPNLGNEQTRVFDRVANLAEEERMVLIVCPRDLLNRAEQDLLRGMAKAT